MQFNKYNSKKNSPDSTQFLVQIHINFSGTYNIMPSIIVDFDQAPIFKKQDGIII